MAKDKSDALLEAVTAMQKALDERDAMKMKLKKAEEVIHVIGEVSGMLDVCDGADAKKLYALCQECRKRLERAASDYWKTVEK